jgi:cytochrome b
VWDIPVRVFHWTLAALVATSLITAQIGGNAMQIHEWSGFTILTLVLFRLLWGVLGSTHARFKAFVRGPRAVWAYAVSLLRSRSAFHAGHNPLGGWMILALLGSLLLQAGTGLFANDDIMTEGPLAKHVSKEISDLLSKIHEANSKLLLVLILVHVAAVLYYLVAKRDNLIASMVTGTKPIPEEEVVPAARGGPVWLAVLLLALCACVVYALIHY